MLSCLFLALCFPVDDLADKDVDVVKFPSFNIPVTLNQKVMDETAQLNLFVSTDQGKSWRLHDTLPKGANHFKIAASKNGVYWFALQRVKHSGEIVPFTRDLTPDLKVKVDAQFTFNARPVERITKTVSDETMLDRILSLTCSWNVLPIPDNESLTAGPGGIVTAFLTKPLFYHTAVEKMVAYSAADTGKGRRGEIIDELGLYPTKLLAFAQVKQIMVCDGIYLCRDGSWNRLGGITLPRDQTILIDSQCNRLDYLQKALHHELYHFIEISSEMNGTDTEWHSLNEPGFTYKYHLENSKSEYRAGFVSQYATSDAVEDKAETFALMICEPDRLEHIAHNDQIVERKVTCIKRRLLLICPEINDAFWDRIAKKRAEQLKREVVARQKQLDEQLRIEGLPHQRFDKIERPKAEASLVKTTSPPASIETPMIHSPVESWSDLFKLLLVLLALIAPISFVILLRGRSG